MKQSIIRIIQKIFNIGTKDIRKEIWNIKTNLSERTSYELRKNQLLEHVLCDTEPGVASERYVDHDIIVSLTTYGKRIYDVSLTIESIMQQSMKPNRIVLYLQSTHNDSLPVSLQNQQRRGLEIVKIGAGLRSYSKIIPQLQQSPNDTIVTVDDDALYEYDILERLINAYIREPNMIHCCRARKIEYGNDGHMSPYINWKLQSEIGPCKLNLQTGVGAVLYPPHCLDEEVVNERVFMNICPTADDVWLYAMALKKGTLINKVYTRDLYGEDYLTNESVQDTGLWHINVEQNGNDSQIEAVFTKYSLYDKLK